MSQVPNSNPLRKHFRQPAIHIRLPSGGKFYPPNTLMLPPNGELPVLPMTAVDEITSRTPDALFNGSAVMEIIASCCPSIRDPWCVPTVDINALLAGIRLASYGHELEISTTCPKCGNAHSMNIDLRMALDSLGQPDYNQAVQTGDLTFYFTPITYRQVNENSKIQFEDQKLIQLLENSEVPEEEKMRRLGDAFRRITRLTIKSIADSISSIKTADALVNDREHIEEYLHNCPKHVFELVREHVIALREQSEFRPVHVICDNCSNEYEQPFSLDMTNFFVTAS